jgi:hypothetical protein
MRYLSLEWICIVRPSDDTLDVQFLLLKFCLQSLVLDDQRILPLLRLPQDSAQASDADVF